MKKLELLKAGAELVVSVGVGLIAGNAIKMVKPSDLGLIKKICVGAGTLVLVDMVSTKAADYVGDQIDETGQKVKEFFKGEDTVIPDEE